MFSRDSCFYKRHKTHVEFAPALGAVGTLHISGGAVFRLDPDIMAVPHEKLTFHLRKKKQNFSFSLPGKPKACALRCMGNAAELKSAVRRDAVLHLRGYLWCQHPGASLDRAPWHLFI